MKQAVWQSLLIVMLAAVLSALGFALRADRLPWEVATFEIDLVQARSLAGAVWVDARADTDFEAGHFEGAVSLNEEDWEGGFPALLDVWAPGAPIVVYCSSESCMRSHHVAERLRGELGIEDAFALRGGWEALLEAGVVEGGAR